MRKVAWPALALLTTLFTLLNCLKPLHCDDGVYYLYAAHISQHPLDPYGFETDAGASANDTLAPPVALYWWALGMRLGADNPFLWKLWMLPFGLLLVLAVYALCRRFCPGLETPLTWMLVLSPAFLPAWNLMLDVPALALGLSAVALFLRADDRRSLALAAAAGCVAGLAMETKYTAFVAPAAMLAYAVLHRRLPAGLTAAAVAGLVFAACEGLIAARYGESHFLHAFRQRNGSFLIRLLHLAMPLAAMFGGLAPVLALLGLPGLKWSRRAIAAASLAVFLGYVLLLVMPEPYATILRDPVTGAARLTLNNLLFGALGLFAVGTLLAVVRDLVRLSSTAGEEDDSRTTNWFLVLWLGLEVACCFGTSPFPAARRVMGITVVATLIVGRLLSSRLREGALGTAWTAAAASAALGFGFYGIDLLDAYAAKSADESAVASIHAAHPDASVWYYGWTGYRFYGEHQGMKPALTDRPLLRSGDWYVLDSRLSVSDSELGPLKPRLEYDHKIDVTDFCPLQVAPRYYCGRTPIEHCNGPRYSLKLFRLR